MSTPLNFSIFLSYWPCPGSWSWHADSLISFRYIHCPLPLILDSDQCWGWGGSYCATILEFSFVCRGRCPAGGGAALAHGYHGHHRHHQRQPRHAACCSLPSVNTQVPGCGRLSSQHLYLMCERCHHYLDKPSMWFSMSCFMAVQIR